MEIELFHLLKELFRLLNLYDFGAYDRQIHFGRKAMLLDKTHHARPGGIKPKEQINVNPHVAE